MARFAGYRSGPQTPARLATWCVVAAVAGIAALALLAPSSKATAERAAADWMYPLIANM